MCRLPEGLVEWTAASGYGWLVKPSTPSTPVGGARQSMGSQNVAGCAGYRFSDTFVSVTPPVGNAGRRR